MGVITTTIGVDVGLDLASSEETPKGAGRVMHASALAANRSEHTMISHSRLLNRDDPVSTPARRFKRNTSHETADTVLD